MRRILYTTAAALAFALAASTAATAQGRGHDGDRGDHGRGHQDRGGEGRGEGHGRGHDGDRGRGRDEVRTVRVAPVALAQGRDDRQDRREDMREDRRDRREDRPVITVADNGQVVLLRRAPDRGLIAGCPPGLARKDNGCLPPGQARRIARMERARFDSLWDRRDDGFDYVYRDGYVYRLTPQGSLLGYVPVLGGALGLGNPWPQQYAYQPVPTYYSSYYGLNRPYDYRYADGAIYGLDPKTQAIAQVAALLTGQDINVGQRMPAGYDVYNVPYAYRAQYVDTPQSLYRYNDGYVYQVDPTTRLVQAAIQLLT